MPTITELAVGQRVRVRWNGRTGDAWHIPGWQDGRECEAAGTIVTIETGFGELSVGVQFDLSFPHGNRLFGACQDLHGQWVPPSACTVIGVGDEETQEEEPEPEPEEPSCNTCSEPESECTCWHCGGCDERQLEDTWPCVTCENCEYCCNCSICNHCHEPIRPSYFCTRCDRCDNCGCECENRAGVEFLKPPERPVFHEGQICAENPTRRFIACEIEIAETETGNAAVLDVMRKWRGGIVEDGSLPEGGYEINTAPASGKAFVTQVREIGEAMRRGGAVATKACGLHVHADARDFSYYDLRRLIMLYAHIEPALFAIVPKSRRESTYCAPCGSLYLKGLKHSRLPKDSKKVIIGNVYGGNEKPDRSSKWGAQRYHAMNLHSWFFRGTVELRLPSGTARQEKIIGWGILWASVLDVALRKTEAEIEATVGSTSPYEALLSIAPTEGVREFIKERTKRFED